MDCPDASVTGVPPHLGTVTTAPWSLGFCAPRLAIVVQYTLSASRTIAPAPGWWVARTTVASLAQALAPPATAPVQLPQAMTMTAPANVPLTPSTFLLSFPVSFYLGPFMTDPESSSQYTLVASMATPEGPFDCDASVVTVPPFAGTDPTYPATAAPSPMSVK